MEVFGQYEKPDKYDFSLFSGRPWCPVLDTLFSPSRHKELVAVGEALQTINEKLAAGGKDNYSPPDWMKTEKMNEDWTRMEEAEKKRDHALKLRLELAELQSLLPPHLLS